MQSKGIVKQENGKKVRNIEVSVDACAELGGQVYEVIRALRDVYRLSNLRNITYVDTYQGLREKSDSTTPETLFAFGEPYSSYGKFLFNSRDWHRISETNECKIFTDTLGRDILPTMTAPIFDAVDEISGEIRKDAFAAMQKRGQKTISGKRIHSAADIEIAIHSDIPRQHNHDLHLAVADPLVKEAIDRSMKKWAKIVESNPVLSQSKSENKKKGMLKKLIASTQECKAIAAALLYHNNPDEAKRMGDIPPMISKSTELPSLQTLRESSHKFGHLTFPKNNGIWQQPEVQQAVRYTSLWPWSRKPYMREEAHDKLRKSHKNTADRAAVSYFINTLSRRKNSDETLYILVTHDGPLISDFIKFITGIEKTDVKIKDSKVKGVGKQTKTEFVMVPQTEYSARGLMPVIPETQPYSAILTGKEFVTFAKREQERVLKRAPMTHELQQAMDTLSSNINLLEDVVKRDKQKFGLTKGGTFAERVRANTASGNFAKPAHRQYV